MTAFQRNNHKEWRRVRRWYNCYFGLDLSSKPDMSYPPFKLYKFQEKAFKQLLETSKNQKLFMTPIRTRKSCLEIMKEKLKGGEIKAIVFDELREKPKREDAVVKLMMHITTGEENETV